MKEIASQSHLIFCQTILRAFSHAHHVCSQVSVGISNKSEAKVSCALATPGIQTARSPAVFTVSDRAAMVSSPRASTSAVLGARALFTVTGPGVSHQRREGCMTVILPGVPPRSLCSQSPSSCFTSPLSSLPSLPPEDKIKEPQEVDTFLSVCGEAKCPDDKSWLNMTETYACVELWRRSLSVLSRICS